MNELKRVSIRLNKENIDLIDMFISKYNKLNLTRNQVVNSAVKEFCKEISDKYGTI